MDLAFVAVIVQLIFLECILSLDNAAVMGAMVAHLPNDKPIPWPRALAAIGRPTDRFWGSQRDAALKIGLFGAYAGRVLMLLAAGLIMRVHWFQIIGALYLVYLCIHHFAELHAASREEEGAPPRPRQGFWGVVLALNLADMAFSLDNVVAAVALSDKLWVVILGVGIGIVVVRFAATIFTRLISWEPALEHTAYLLILAIGGELLLDTVFEVHTDDGVRFAISVGLMLGSLLIVRSRLRRPWRLVARPLLFAAGLVNAGIVALVGALTLPIRLLSR